MAFRDRGTLALQMGFSSQNMRDGEIPFYCSFKRRAVLYRSPSSPVSEGVLELYLYPFSAHLAIPRTRSLGATSEFDVALPALIGEVFTPKSICQSVVCCKLSSQCCGCCRSDLRSSVLQRDDRTALLRPSVFRTHGILTESKYNSGWRQGCVIIQLSKLEVVVFGRTIAFEILLHPADRSSLKYSDDHHTDWVGVGIVSTNSRARTARARTARVA